MKTAKPTPDHKAYLDDLKATLGRHVHLTPMDMLAISSHFVGTLIALQDQTKVTPAMAMQLVATNIEMGNRDAISGLIDTEGKA